MSKKQEVKKKRVIDVNITDQENELTKSTNENAAAGACENENLTDMVAELMGSSQTSSGGLVTEPSKFRNIGWTTEEIPIDQIQHFTRIPDFYLPTESDRPRVAKTPKGISCLDGWDIIEIAKSKGAKSIVVDVDNMEEHSEEELGLRKMVVRMNTRGGIVYAEIIRNTRDIYLMLLSSGEENLKVFSHGGRRDKIALDGNRETDVVEILARRMRKDRDTVTAQLLHCKYLSTKAIKYLIKKQAKKKFFEGVQNKKRALITQLTGNQKSAIEITAAISDFIIDAFEKSIAPKMEGVTPSAAPAIPQPAASQSESIPDDDVDEFNEDDSNDSEESQEDVPEDPTDEDESRSDETVEKTEEPLTVETIKYKVMTVTKQVMEDFSKDISLTEMRASLEKELNVIMTLLSRIDSLNREGR